MRKKKHLTIDEKRGWLADIFRDESGEFSQADKFKAMVEDTRLAVLQEEKENTAERAKSGFSPLSLLEQLPPPLTGAARGSLSPEGDL